MKTIFQKSHFDEERAINKARKIQRVFKDFINLEKASCLDLGCGTGLISHCLSPYCREIIGVDINEEAIALAKRLVAPNLKFITLLNQNKLPFPDYYFDVVVYHGVLNYVKDYRKQVGEIFRILKIGGVCYFSCANKYRLLGERFHGIPNFVCWFPMRIIKLYIKVRGQTKVVPDFFFLPSYRQIKRLFSQFKIYDYTSKVVLEPVKYGFDDGKIPSWIKNLPLPLLKLSFLFASNFIMVLKKP